MHTDLRVRRVKRRTEKLRVILSNLPMSVSIRVHENLKNSFERTLGLDVNNNMFPFNVSLLSG